jgi:nicotinate-nucleotide adenylyltransferase
VSAPKERVLFFGGSFNPPHLAHMLALCVARAQEAPDAMLVVPTFRHPFAKALVDFESRLAMCTAAFGWIPGVVVSRVEETLGGESRTLRTLEHLQAEHPNWALRLLVGADILGEADKWYGWDRIVRIAPPLVLGRAGVTHPDAPPPVLPAISSTELRATLARGDFAGARPYLAKDVLAIIEARGFYRTTDGPPVG